MSANQFNALSFSSPGPIHNKALAKCLISLFLLSIFILLPFSLAYPKGKKLSIKSKPSDAKVFIDGDFCGRTPLEIKLKKGKYQLLVKKKGYVSYHDVVRIKKTKKTKLNVILESKDRYGVVTIKTKPSNARVFINGEYYDLSPVRLELPEGKAGIKVAKNGYNIVYQKIIVYSDQKNKFFYDLEPVDHFGTLDLDTVPGNCKVFIDDNYYVDSPLRVRLFSGKHVLKIKKKGYVVYLEDVHIKGGKYQKLKIRLQKKLPHRPRKGLLRVNSIPEGARVFINGEKHGRTPLEIRLKAGEYDLKLKKKGYEPWQQEIDIQRRETVRIFSQLEELERVTRFGTLAITSKPKRAKVFIDNTFRGLTPLSHVRLSPGEHDIRLTKRGFRTFYKTKRIRPGKEYRLAPRLDRVLSSKGTLDIVSKPLNAKVFINGEYIGRTPLHKRLRPDRYSVELRHRGYRPYYQKIRVAPGTDVSVHADMVWKGFSISLPFPPPFPF